MAFREFHDSEGDSWEVWEVLPTPSPSAVEQRGAAIASALRLGWLVFQRGAERRRLAPIPAAWAESSQDALRAFLVQAEVAPSRPGTRPDRDAIEDGPRS